MITADTGPRNESRSNPGHMGAYRTVRRLAGRVRGGAHGMRLTITCTV